MIVCLVIAGCSNDSPTDDSSAEEQQDQTAQNQTFDPNTFADTDPSESIGSPALKVDLPNPMENAQLVTISRESLANESAIADTPVTQPKNNEDAVEPLPGESTDLFVSSLRMWKDDKGLFSTNAELLAVSTSSREIRLLKENGVIVTVPFDRLSVHDKNFIALFMNAARKKVKKVTPQLVETFE